MKMFSYEDKIQHWVNRLAFQLRSEATRRLQASGVDLAVEEWALMMVLWREQEIGMGELARRTLRERTTVTRVLDRLSAKGLVERRADARDRRAMVVTPSPDGWRIQQAALLALAPLYDGLTRDLDPDDRAATLRTLRRLSERLENAEEAAETGDREGTAPGS